MVKLTGEMGWDEVIETALPDALKKWIMDELLRRKMLPVTEFVVPIDDADAKRMHGLAKCRLVVDVVGFKGVMLFDFEPSVGFLFEVDSPWNSAVQVHSNGEKLKLLSDSYGCSAVQVRLKEPKIAIDGRFDDAYCRFRDEFESRFVMRGSFEDVTYRKFLRSQLVFVNPMVELEVLFEVYAKRARRVVFPKKRVLWWLNYLLDGDFLRVGLGGHTDRKLIDSYLELWKLKRGHFFRKGMHHSSCMPRTTPERGACLAPSAPLTHSNFEPTSPPTAKRFSAFPKLRMDEIARRDGCA